MLAPPRLDRVEIRVTDNGLVLGFGGVGTMVIEVGAGVLGEVLEGRGMRAWKKEGRR